MAPAATTAGPKGGIELGGVREGPPVRRTESGSRDVRRAPGAAGRPVKRSFTIGGHRTSISLEAPFWDALKTAAAEDGVPMAQLIAHIDAEREGCGLSSAVRLWLFARCRGGA
jgi:predicted DNA-binding ribbon-helix-helix protein